MSVQVMLGPDLYYNALGPDLYYNALFLFPLNFAHSALCGI